MLARTSRLITAIIVGLFLATCPFSACRAAAADGVLDLSGWDFSARGNVSLDGNWAFYWGGLSAPQAENSAVPTGYFPVPSYWTRYPGFPSQGTAAYRLTVNTADAGLYALKLPEIYTEYALWVNGVLLDANGSFAGREAVYLHPGVYDFQTDSAQITIVLQVQNAAHVYGSIGQSLRLGLPQAIHREWALETAADAALAAVCLFAGLYYLALYLYKRGGREQLWFFALCAAVTVRALLCNTTLVLQVYPALPFWLGSKIVTLTIPAMIVSMLFYSRRMVEGGIPRPALTGFTVLNGLYAALVLATPSAFYTRLFAPYLLTVGAACALGLTLSVRAVLRREEGAVFFLAGLLLLSAGALTDSLVYLQILRTQYVLTAALSGYILLQAVWLAKRYAASFYRAEHLSADLQRSLDRLRNTETAFLGAQIKPHFLYNTLTAIAEKCETAPAEAGQLILSLSKYLRNTLDYGSLGGLIPLKKELELVQAYTAIERARFSNIRVVLDVPEGLLSLRLPPLCLQPLVENAIKHGLRKRREGGCVTVSAVSLENSVLFRVQDDGVGIAKEALRSLFDQPGAGIGLNNINARLIRLYGKGLTVQSENGAGTTVCFEIPKAYNASAAAAANDAQV